MDFFKKYYTVIVFISLIILGTIICFYLDKTETYKYDVVFVDDLNDIQNK